MKRLLVAIAACVVLAGCGGSAAPAPSQPIAPATASVAPQPPTPSASASSAPRTQAVEVYFTAAGKLAPETAQVSGETPASEALGLLLQGPKTAGHLTEIPKGTQLQKVTITDRTAAVSFDQAFFSPGGASGVQLRLGQVVYTLTQFPAVASVQFLRDGQPVGLIGEGFPLNRPLTRDAFASLQQS